jgi:3-oxoacyl-[acyl-carrier-protein] synthase-1/3-oxoacyl-[acyl-carrier-protein] synthase II
MVTACASGADAIGTASRWIRAGRCDVVVAGGADALDRYPYLGFARLGNSSPERCRPFDLCRRGLNLGEGAAALVLEPLAAVLERGGRPRAILAGYGAAADAHHPTAPHPEGRGLRRALAVALAQAGLRPEEIGFVNAHGTGTIDNDRVEGRVLAEVFAAGVPVLSTKGATGHTTGAAGALEAVFTIRSLEERLVPGSAGFEVPDPECRVVPPARSRRVEARAALSSSLAFGGANSVLVFRRWDR